MSLTVSDLHYYDSFFFDCGCYLLVNDRVPEAIQNFASGLYYNPNNPLLYFGLTAGHNALKLWMQAQAYYMEAAALAPQLCVEFQGERMNQIVYERSAAYAKFLETFVMVEATSSTPPLTDFANSDVVSTFDQSYFGLQDDPDSTSQS